MKDPRHSVAEDVHALLIGSSFVAFGLVMLKAAGLITGGVAGIALTVSYLTHWPVGLLFFLINLPFYALGWRSMGGEFMLKTAIANGLLLGLSLLLPHLMGFSDVHPLFAALFGGTIIGMGVLSLARHRASIGGIGILALYMQEKRGVSAGKVQIVSDLVIIGAGFLAVPADRLMLSVVSAVALSVVIIAYHRPGRYMGY